MAKLDHVLKVRVSRGMRRALDREAKRLDVSASAVTRRALIRAGVDGEMGRLRECWRRHKRKSRQGTTGGQRVMSATRGLSLCLYDKAVFCGRQVWGRPR